MLRTSAKPAPGAVTPLDENDLTDVFSTREPTRNHLEDDEALFEMIERGHGVSFVVYENGLPSEICFAGYGQCLIHIEAAVLDRLRAMRKLGERYSV
jgi:hypothetical protein